MKKQTFSFCTPGQITCTRTLLTKFVGGLFKVLHQHHQHVPAHEKIFKKLYIYIYIYIFLSCTEPCRYVLKIQLHCIPSPWSSSLHTTSGNWSEAPLSTQPILRLQNISKVFQIKQSPKGTPLALIICLDHRKTLILPPVIQAWLLPRYRCFYNDKYWSTPVLWV
jgi:hypothetical protein